MGEGRREVARRAAEAPPGIALTAAAPQIGAGNWAKIGIPMGLVLLGIYFAFLEVVG